MRDEDRVGRSARIVAEAIGFLALAILLTWPLALQLGSQLPLGTEAAATVPLFNLWTLWWNRHWLEHLDTGYWAAPIFHPVDNTFAGSEPQPLAGMVAAPIVWLGGSDALAYNIVLLLALAGNGITFTALLRALRLGPAASRAGGAMAVALPFVHQQLGVLQLVPLGGVIGVLLALRRVELSPGPRAGLALGAALGATYLLCVNYALLLAVAVLPLAALVLFPIARRRATWLSLALAIALAAALVAPVATAQLRAAKQEGWFRAPATVAALAARPGDFLRPPYPELLALPGQEPPEDPAERAFWPGSLKVALALAGLAAGVRFPEQRRWTLGLALTAALGFALALGPGDPVLGFSLHRALVELIPGFAEIRSFARAAVFTQLAVIALAAQGCWWLARARVPSRLRAALLTTLALGACFELRIPAAALLSLPPPGDAPPWLEFVARLPERDGALAFLPLPEGGAVEDQLPSAQWMFWQMRHGRPMVNGYSGFVPRGHDDLVRATKGFPDPLSLGMLHRAGVGHCIVPRTFLEPPELARQARHRLRRVRLDLERVLSDDQAGIDVYAIVDRSRRP